VKFDPYSDGPLLSRPMQRLVVICAFVVVVTALLVVLL
jgi:hypothetical protein